MTAGNNQHSNDRSPNKNLAKEIERKGSEEYPRRSMYHQQELNRSINDGDKKLMRSRQAGGGITFLGALARTTAVALLSFAADTGSSSSSSSRKVEAFTVRSIPRGAPPSSCHHTSPIHIKGHDQPSVSNRKSSLWMAETVFEPASRTWDQPRRRRFGETVEEDQDEHRSSSGRQPVFRGRKGEPMPITGYDSNSILEFYDRRPLEVGWRLNVLGLPLLGWYVGLLMDKWMGIEEKTSVQKKRGAELRQHLVRSGSVALIKSGQALSLRPDLIKVKGWTDELGKLVDAVGSFRDDTAMHIMSKELSDLVPRIRAANAMPKRRSSSRGPISKLQNMAERDPVLSLFEFYNDHRAVASASIGQVYKARIKRGAQLEAAIGKEEAAKWGGKIVAIKIQRPDAAASVSLDMYLIRRTAMWLSKFRGGDLPAIADQFGMQLFGELDYVREADNCARFQELYGTWDNVMVPSACNALTRKRVLVMEWVDGKKGPWLEEEGGGIDMVRTGLKCSVDQLMCTGLFHADPHRGNLLRTPDGKLAFIDFGMMADVSEEECYGLVGLVIGLQNKDLPLVTEELLKLGFLKDATQVDVLVPRLREAFRQATGGTSKASDVNFAQLQAELDNIARENVLKFSTPPFFTVIIRSLTILEGMAQAVDSKFRLVRGSYPYVLRQLLSEKNQDPPAALQKLLSRLLTVNGEEREIEWKRLNDFLRLAQKASRSYNPKQDAANADDKTSLSRQTIELFFKFLTSRTGLFLKKPLVHELAEVIDGMASVGEQNLLRWTALPPLPGMLGPINQKRMDELQIMLNTFQEALLMGQQKGEDQSQQQQHQGGMSTMTTATGPLARIESTTSFLRELVDIMNDERIRDDAGPMFREIQSVFQLVAVEVLEIRGSRAMRSILRL